MPKKKSARAKSKPTKRAAKKPPAKTKAPVKKAAKKKTAKAAKRKPPTRSAASQTRERERKATYAAEGRAANSNIGPPPPIPAAWPESIKNPPKLSPIKLRAACARNLKLWNQVVFPNTTGLKPFGPDQEASLKVSFEIIEEGGLLQLLEPRRFGKTSRTINNALHALLYASRRFIAICGANTDFASGIFDAIKLELETNPILQVMFPEVCHPIERLNGKGQIKANTQHIDGVPTNMTWGKDELTLATVEGAKQSGATIMVKPIGGVRGMFKRVSTPLGVATIRPDLYLLDDIQTDKSAASEKMTTSLMNLIEKGVMFGADVSNPPTVINLATMIKPGDLTDQIADNPAWITVRYSAVKQRANKTAEKVHWFGGYAKLRRDYRRVKGDPIKTKRNKDTAAKKALAYYRKNRKAMDADTAVAWKWSFPWNAKKKLCVSAIQFAYDVIIDFGEDVFATEMQNNPKRQTVVVQDVSKATAEQLEQAVVSVKRGVVPIDMPRMVVYVDVHKRLFYWVAVAKNLANQKRHVVDYDTWPKQQAVDFTLENAKITIPQMFPGLGTKALAKKAVGKFLTHIVGRRWRNQKGQVARLSEIRVDANWGGTTDQVREAILNHSAVDRTWGCHGIGRNEDQTGLDDWARKKGEEKGYAHIRKESTDHGVKQLDIETNIWKTETHMAITTPNDQDGTLTFFASDDRDHDLFFKHLLVEECEAKAGKRDIEIWENPKNGQNHFFDCLVGAVVDDDKVEEQEAGNTYSFGA